MHLLGPSILTVQYGAHNLDHVRPSLSARHIFAFANQLPPPFLGLGDGDLFVLSTLALHIYEGLFESELVIERTPSP